MKNTHRHSLMAAVIMASSGFIVGCGGGSGGPGVNSDPSPLEQIDNFGTSTNGNTTVAPAPTDSGVFLDSAVSGMAYTSESVSGFTDADGGFDYVEGELITFSIGDIVMGTTVGGAELTPISFTRDDDESMYKHINMLRLLQTLDEDGDVDNGIQLPEGIGIGHAPIEFDQPTEDFESDQAVVDFVAANANTTLIPVDQATDHFAITLSGTEIGAQLMFDQFPVDTVWVGSVRQESECGTVWVPAEKRFDIIDGRSSRVTATVTEIDQETCTATAITWSDVEVFEPVDHAVNLFEHMPFACYLACTYGDVNVSRSLDSEHLIMSYNPDTQVARRYTTVLDEHGDVISSEFMRYEPLVVEAEDAEEAPVE